MLTVRISLRRNLSFISDRAFVTFKMPKPMSCVWDFYFYILEKTLKKKQKQNVLKKVMKQLITFKEYLLSNFSH